MATKAKKFPKKPSKKSSLKIWEKYQDKCKKVNGFNSQLEKDKAKKENIIKNIDKLKK